MVGKDQTEQDDQDDGGQTAGDQSQHDGLGLRALAAKDLGNMGAGHGDDCVGAVLRADHQDAVVLDRVCAVGGPDRVGGKALVGVLLEGVQGGVQLPTVLAHP